VAAKGFSPLYLNLDLINERAADIKSALQLLATYGSLPKHDFLANETILSAAKYQLLVAIEAAQTICSHLAARVAKKAPASYADCFMTLFQASIIERELAGKLAAMAKFRNLLVHRYADIDNDRVYAIINNDLKDLEEYLKQVGKFIIGVLGNEK